MAAKEPLTEAEATERIREIVSQDYEYKEQLEQEIEEFKLRFDRWLEVDRIFTQVDFAERRLNRLKPKNYEIKRNAYIATGILVILVLLFGCFYEVYQASQLGDTVVEMLLKELKIRQAFQYATFAVVVLWLLQYV